MSRLDWPLGLRREERSWGEVANCPCAVRGIGRRAASGLGLALLAAPRFALAQDRSRTRAAGKATCWSKTGAADPEPLKAADLPLDGKQTLAWPMDPETRRVRNGSRLNKVLLLRLDPEGFDAETQERAADGVVGYSAICPHTGCDVTNWHAGDAAARMPVPLSRNTIRRKGHRWSADRRRAACRPCR